MTEFQRAIIKHREQHGTTYREIAEAVGVSVPTVCRWVNGSRTPGHREIAATLDAMGADDVTRRVVLCEAIGITPDELRAMAGL